MDCLYHGSIVSGIDRIKPYSLLHGSKEKALYLTDNIPYALFYIWDGEHNHYSGKHVTAWVKNNTAYYEEQFPDQMKCFYKGVSGYLYVVSHTSDICAMENRESLYYSLESAAVWRQEYIPDVYDELVKYELSGELKVLRFNEQPEKRQNELIDLIAASIVNEDCFNDNVKSEFYKRYFKEAWKRAARN